MSSVSPGGGSTLTFDPESKEFKTVQTAVDCGGFPYLQVDRANNHLYFLENAWFPEDRKADITQYPIISSGEDVGRLDENGRVSVDYHKNLHGTLFGGRKKYLAVINRYVDVLF